MLLVTTLLDPLSYPSQALAQLYLRRWEMEICFRHLKTTLQMDHLSCRSPAMIDRELRLHFLTHNLVRRVALEAARCHLVPVQRISFAGTLGPCTPSPKPACAPEPPNEYASTNCWQQTWFQNAPPD